jgi:ABC-type multidrug transport system ATPase subunit
LWGNHYPQLGYIGDPSFCPGETGLPTGISVNKLLDSFKAICSVSEKDYHDFEEGLGFNKFLDKNISNLSNGERKKLMIFLALTKQPKLLIADEATDGLDEQSKAFFMSKLENLLQNSNLSLLWISHQYYEVAKLTDTIYKLAEGQLTSTAQKRFDCEVSTYPEESICGSYKNLSPKGWLEIVSKVYGSPEITSFEVKGTRTLGE